MSRVASRAKPAILYIDDEPENLIGFKYMFRRDYDLALAQTVDEALELLRERRFDVIISDQRMPEMTGVEFFERIRDRHPHAVRMILTGYSDFEAVVAAINQGKIFHFFRKPWNADEVRIVVANALEMVRLDELLRQADKLQALGSMTGGIAHDFNNQIQCVLGHALLIQRESRETSTQERITPIIQAVERSADLVRQLLAFSRKQPLDRRTFAVHPIVQEVADLLRAAGGDRIRIVTDLRADDDRTAGDPSLLQSALLNLGLNARDALPEGGSISLTSATRQIDEMIDVDGTPLGPGDYLLVAVDDDGIGMSAEVQTRIFEPFFTTKADTHGTGLGMAAVYGTIIGMDGAIAVDSAPGAGSRFELWLPLANHASTADATATEAAKNARARTGGERIIVADDDDGLRPLLAEMIAATGHPVTTCADGDELLADLVGGETPLGAFIDFNMPGTSGQDLLHRLAADHPDLPLVILSGDYLAGALPGDLRRPSWRFMQKPCRLEELQRLVVEHFGG